MNKKKCTLLYLALLVLMVSGAPSHAASVDAAQQLKIAVDQFIQVMIDPELKGSGNSAQRREKLHLLFLEHFDQMEIARKALGRHWDDRAPQQKQDFARVFANLLERNYFDKIDDYLNESASFSAESVQYGKVNLRRGYAIIQTIVTTGPDATIPVDYQMKLREGRWRICDIAIEGVSLLRNYRAQFDEILRNDSFEELMRRIETRKE